MRGIIQKDATVLGDDGVTYQLPVRGTDDDGYDEVLVDAKKIGGRGAFQRQSVKPLIGQTVEFVIAPSKVAAYNFTIILPHEKTY